MTSSIKTMTHHRFALLLGAIGLVAVACSDDEDAVVPTGNAGSGGTSAGKGNAGSSNGGTSSAGTSNGGTSNGGASNGGTTNGGTDGAGTGNGGQAGWSAAGSDAGMAGESMGGSDGLGGQGGESLGGAAGSSQGGAGGAPDITPDVLDDANFGAYGTGWSEQGDVDASSFKWIYGEEPGLNHWAATAYKVATLQKLDPLPNGTYSFSMDVQRAATLNDQYLFARGCKAGEPDGEVTQSTAAAGSGALSKITLSNIEVTSGSCTVGIYTDAPADGWANIDNAVFSLQ
jgi:hypothetical protein